MDFFNTFSLVLTLIFSLISVILLSRPFLLDEKSLHEKDTDTSEMDRDERSIKKEMILESLEELEMAKKNQFITEEQYEHQKALIMQDASVLLEG